MRPGVSETGYTVDLVAKRVVEYKIMEMRDILYLKKYIKKLK